MAQARSAWAINRWKKTRLIRGIYFKWFVISSCHFHNVHTEYFGPRKSLQGEFPKSEKENFDEEIATPCLLGVPGGTPLQEPNGDVPLDGVAFSPLE